MLLPMSGTSSSAGPPGTEPQAPAGGAGSRTGIGFYVKPTIYAILLAYVILFVVLNREPVQINFVFLTSQVSMIFALLVTFVVGALLASGLVVWWRRRGAARGADQPGRRR